MRIFKNHKKLCEKNIIIIIPIIYLDNWLKNSIWGIITLQDQLDTVNNLIKKITVQSSMILYDH